MITSLNNEHVKQVRALQSNRRTREKMERYVVEGSILLGEVVQTNTQIEEVFYTEDFASTNDGLALINALSQQGATLIPVDDAVMKSMSDTVTPQGILAVLPMHFPSPPENATFSLIIDSMNDPGNLGTIMRTAAAAGIDLLCLMQGTVDITNPKVVRSAMGAHFRLPMMVLQWDDLGKVLPDQAVFLAEIGSGAPYYDVNWTQPCALIISNEARGPTDSARSAAHAYVTIPMPGGMESLNAGIATGILLFEMVRQRQQNQGDASR